MVAADTRVVEQALKNMVGSVDEMSDSLLEAQKRFTGFAGQFAEMSSSSNKHWTFISRILSGSGLWRVQNRVRALGNFFEILKASEDKAIQGQKEAIKNFKIVQDNVDTYETMLQQINDVQTGNLELADAQAIKEAAIYKFYEAQYGEVKALEKLEAQIQNAKIKNFQALSNLSKDNIDSRIDGYENIEQEEQRLQMIIAEGYVKQSDKMTALQKNYETFVKNGKAHTLEVEQQSVFMALMVETESKKADEIEAQAQAMKDLLAVHGDAYQYSLQYGVEISRQNNLLGHQVKMVADIVEQEAKITEMNNARQADKDLIGNKISEERQSMAKKSGRHALAATAIPGYKIIKDNLPKIWTGIKNINNYEKNKEKMGKFYAKSRDKIKGVFKFFGKMMFVIIYWGIMFALIASAVVGLYQSGFFDLIYNAYLGIKDGLLANKEVFIAVWTTISAFFGSLMTMLSVSQSGTAAQIEYQKADLIAKFTEMVSAAVMALVTLIVAILPVLIEALIIIIPVLIEALIIMVPLFVMLFFAVVEGIIDGLKGWLDSRYAGESLSFWGKIGALLGDMKDWWMDDFYTGEVKGMVDLIFGWLILRWGLLIGIQGTSLAMQSMALTGFMVVFGVFIGLSMAVLGVIALWIGVQTFLKKFMSDGKARAITAIGAMITILGILVFLGVSLVAWPVALLVLAVGIVVWAWDFIYSGIEKLFSFFADGGTVTQQGMQIVGEEGPELVSLPIGTTVYPNEVFRMGTTNRNTKQTNVTINLSVNGRVGASDSEIRDIASKLGRYIEKEVTKQARG